MSYEGRASASDAQDVARTARQWPIYGRTSQPSYGSTGTCRITNVRVRAVAEFLLPDVQWLAPAAESGVPQRHRLWLLAIITPLVVGPIWCACLSWLPAPLGTLNGLILVAMLGMATVTDLRQRKIYNWTTYPAWGWALFLNVISGPSLLIGTVGLRDSLAGSAICFGWVFCAFVCSRGGAGDVKLAAAMGALLGCECGVLAVAFGYVVAGASILTVRILADGLGAFMRTEFQRARAIAFPNWFVPPPVDRRADWHGAIPLAPFFGVGTILALLWTNL